MRRAVAARSGSAIATSTAARVAATAAGHGRRGEHEGAGVDPQVLDDVAVAGDDPAARRERLAERPHDEIGRLRHPRGEPGTVGAEHAERVGLVEQRARAGGPRDVGEAVDVDGVALHREDRVPHHHRRRVDPAQLRRELVEVVVAHRDGAARPTGGRRPRSTRGSGRRRRSRRRDRRAWPASRGSRGTRR